MEIFGKVVDEKGVPIVGASITRYYPNGAVYSSVINSGEGGLFNGRVPDQQHFWSVAAPGHLPMPVSLENALHNRPDLPIIVQLEPDPLLAVSTVADPQPIQEENVSPVLWIVGGIAVAIGGLWIFGDNRTKVKMRKILR